MLKSLFSRFASLTLIGIGCLLVTANSQTIIQNERLVNTTLVVMNGFNIAECFKTGCRATKTLLDSIPITCPGGSGQTCTLHISLDVKMSTPFYCTIPGCVGFTEPGLYQFLVDGAAPDLGPTGRNGGYWLENNLFSQNFGAPLRQSFPASVLATVTNGDSDQHTVSVKIGCEDTIQQGGCQILSHQGTMRIDAFEP